MSYVYLSLLNVVATKLPSLLCSFSLYVSYMTLQTYETTTEKNMVIKIPTQWGSIIIIRYINIHCHNRGSNCLFCPLEHGIMIEFHFDLFFNVMAM